jgi:hypothetical protein
MALAGRLAPPLVRGARGDVIVAPPGTASVMVAVVGERDRGAPAGFSPAPPMR